MNEYPISIKVPTQQPYVKHRGPVQKKEDLINPETWSYDIDKNGNKVFYLYPGLLVSVLSSHDIYMLVDINKVTNPDYSGWVLVGSPVSSVILDGGSVTSYYAEDQKIRGGGVDASE